MFKKITKFQKNQGNSRHLENKKKLYRKTFSNHFVHRIFRVWFLVTFGNKVKKIQKYYLIFVYILQGKMEKNEKNLWN